MKKKIFIFIVGLLLIGAYIYADDVSIDSNGNITTGVSSSGNLEVTGGSAEKAIVGQSSGTGGSGVYGINTTSGNYGYLGWDTYGVYGYNPTGWAGYFQGNARITGDVTIDGSIYGPVIGDITGVMAGTGLSGGGTSDDVTINADTTYLQRRVSGTCAGQVMVGINADGTVTCETDNTGGGGGSLWSQSGSDIYYNSGDVGIGTASPGGYKLKVEGSTSQFLGFFSNVNNTGQTAGIFVRANAYGSGSGGGYGANIEANGGSISGEAYGIENYARAYGSSTAYGIYSNATQGSTTGREYAFYGVGDGYFSGNVGIGIDTPGEKLTVAGTIESTSGGIKFPDGTVQTTSPAGQTCDVGLAVTGFDQNGNIICSSLQIGDIYEIGDTGPAGGIVFYVTDGGLHGLEASPQDQSSGAQWGCYGTAIAGADGTAVGTGFLNTFDIAKTCIENGIASRIAHFYALGGYYDWFLPSKQELHELYLHKDVVGGFADFYYWSSSEHSSIDAWGQYFGDQIQWIYTSKTDVLRVRAVRAF